MSWHYLDLGEYLVIAEAVLGIPAEHLSGSPRLGGAESALYAPQVVVFGEEQYPDFHVKAAILCWRLIRNHPLPDGNKRVAFLCLVEFVERNGGQLEFENDDAFDVLMGVAAGHVSEAELAEWIAPRLRRLN